MSRLSFSTLPRERLCLHEYTFGFPAGLPRGGDLLPDRSPLFPLSQYARNEASIRTRMASLSQHGSGWARPHPPIAGPPHAPFRKSTSSKDLQSFSQFSQWTCGAQIAFDPVEGHSLGFRNEAKAEPEASQRKDCIQQKRRNTAQSIQQAEKRE